jgi:serine/threonine protein kinase
MNATRTAQDIDAAVERYRLISSKELADMRARWFRPERQNAGDTEEFCRWLVLNNYITDFVAKVLSGRKSDHLVLNEYRVLDQLTSGPMQGAYLAIDPLDRRVAIEIFESKRAAERTALTAFQEAAAKAQAVQHPNVGRIVEMGEAHGLHYLVKEFDEGQTLEQVLERRHKLPYALATRLMALAFAGLDALHRHNVPAGDLSAACLLLAPSGKDAHQRTVKILHVGVRRAAFDETALGRSISMGGLTADQVKRALELARSGAPEALDDMFRLGCLFYRCVTGNAPYSAKDMEFPRHAATPVSHLVPDIPELLGQLIDELIDPDVSKRPRKAGHVAKSLRVLLAADEQAREAVVEENLARPAEVTAKAPEETAEDAAPEAEDDEEVEEPRPRRRRAAAAATGPWEQLLAWWEENRPEVRDLLFLAGGALGMLALIFLAELLSGLRLTYIAGLATGVAASYFVDLIVRWRKSKMEMS